MKDSTIYNKKKIKPKDSKRHSVTANVMKEKDLAWYEKEANRFSISRDIMELTMLKDFKRDLDDIEKRILDIFRNEM